MNESQTIQRAAKADAGVWFETFGKIWPKDRSRGLVTPRQNRLQVRIQDVVNKFDDLGLPVRILGLKPRQKGSTTYFSCEDYHKIRKSSISACVIGGQYSQTVSLWEMLQTYNNNDRLDWGNTGTINDTTGEWSNGSKLIKETAKDSLAGISNTFQIIHATEVAKWSKYGVSNAAAVLTNLLKCVPNLPGTMIVLESTAEGNSGTFFERYVRAVDAEKFISGEIKIKAGDFIRVFAAWFEFDDSAIRLDPSEKLDVQRSLDSNPNFEGERDLIQKYGVTGQDGIMRLGTSVTDFDVWEQLAWRRWAIREECENDKAIFDRDYPHSWQDAFMKSGLQRFNIASMAKMRKRMGMRAALYGVLEGKPEDRPAFRQTERNEAKVILYERPTVGRRYLLSIDPMTGASQTAGEDPDLHGINVLRDGYWDGEHQWNRRAQVAKLIPCRWDIDVVAEECWRLAKYFGDSSGCKTAIEMNQDRGITELLKQKGADLYQREVFNQREYKTTKAYGYMTMPNTRETWVECLARAIREYDTPGEGIDVFDEYTIEQLENFVKKPNGSSAAAEGFHDDEVSSLAIGLLLIDHATSYFPHRAGEGLPPDLAALSKPTGPVVSMFS